MKLFKNKKGSQLVETILMAAFAVAAGGAVVVYGSKVITNAKNTQITGILGNGGQGGQMTQEEIAAHFNDSSRQITLSASELNSINFSALNSVITSSRVSDSEWNALWGTSISYNGTTWGFDEYVWGDEQCCHDKYIAYCADEVIFIGETEYPTGGTISGISLTEYLGDYLCSDSIGVYCTDRRKVQFQSELVWNVPDSNLYNKFKAAIIANL